MKRKNERSLDMIADSLHRAERTNVIDIGDLLLEAKAQCEHGQWLAWLSAEFTWSEDTAARYMKVATLAAKFRSLRNLNLAVTTLYELADHERDEELPAIIAELAKHATKTRLRPDEARRVTRIVIGRSRFGDHPDATLEMLALIQDSCLEPWYEKAVSALLERKPRTDKSASLLVEDVVVAHEAEAEEDGIKSDTEEIDSILDGPPPDLRPPSIIPPEPQKFAAADPKWEAREFVDAVTVLLRLRSKPAKRFVGKCEPSDLRRVADFLLDIGSGAEKGASSSELAKSD